MLGPQAKARPLHAAVRVVDDPPERRAPDVYRIVAVLSSNADLRRRREEPVTERELVGGGGRDLRGGARRREAHHGHGRRRRSKPLHVATLSQTVGPPAAF